MKTNKRGNVGTWAAIGFAVAGTIIGLAITALVLEAFRNSQVTNTAGCNSTAVTACNAAYNVSQGGLTFTLNSTSQLGTTGTILGVMLIVAVVGAFGLLGYQAYKNRT